MAGQIIVVQKRISLNLSNLAGSTTTDYIIAPAIAVPHARELIIDARLTQRNIAATTCELRVRGFYPDPDDGSDVTGTDFITIDLKTSPSSIPGIATGTQVNNIPAWVRVLMRVVQPASPGAVQLTMSINIISRE